MVGMGRMEMMKTTPNCSGRSLAHCSTLLRLSQLSVSFIKYRSVVNICTPTVVTDLYHTSFNEKTRHVLKFFSPCPSNWKRPDGFDL